jgi:hypothetical protein
MFQAMFDALTSMLPKRSVSPLCWIGLQWLTRYSRRGHRSQGESSSTTRHVKTNVSGRGRNTTCINEQTPTQSNWVPRNHFLLNLAATRRLRPVSLHQHLHDPHGPTPIPASEHGIVIQMMVKLIQLHAILILAHRLCLWAKAVVLL